MKVQVRIPKGWRKLRNGEWVKKGDRYITWNEMKWILVQAYRIDYVVGTCRKDEDVYIRKNTRRTV